MTHQHEDPVDVDAMFTQAFWDERYAGSTRVWSGRPNQRLVEQVGGLEPGTAVDVGCGEGADVVWLAQQGWQATGVDVSQVALDRAAAHAEESGVAGRTSFARVDVVGGAALPGQHDLVTSAFLHPPPQVFGPTYRSLMAAVRPDGRLLVIGHHPADAGTGLRNPQLVRLLFTPEQLVALLDPEEWEVEVADAPTRPHTHDGAVLTLTDTVVRARRR